MTELIEDRAILDGPRGAVWAILADPAAIARVLPGAESVVGSGPWRFRCVLSTRLQFMTIRADVDAAILELDQPGHMLLELDGRPRGIGGSFRLSIPLDLAPLDGPAGPGSRTSVSYAIDLAVTGRLASFGAPLLRDTMRRQISVLVANIDREISGRDESAGAPG